MDTAAEVGQREVAAYKGRPESLSHSQVQDPTRCDVWEQHSVQPGLRWNWGTLRGGQCRRKNGGRGGALAGRDAAERGLRLSKLAGGVAAAADNAFSTALERL